MEASPEAHLILQRWECFLLGPVKNGRFLPWKKTGGQIAKKIAKGIVFVELKDFTLIPKPKKINWKQK